MRECSEDNCTYPVFSKGKCKYHMQRKPLRKSSALVSKKAPSDNRMRDFFLSVWNSRPHRSEISNTPIFGEILSTYFHHIIEKSDIMYGELGKFDAENIIIITPQEHDDIHRDMYLYEEVNKRREKLLEKYEKTNNVKNINSM